VTGWWFSSGTFEYSTNVTDCHNITEILLKMRIITGKKSTCMINQVIIYFLKNESASGNKEWSESGSLS
jgi:hypothetical protein